MESVKLALMKRIEEAMPEVHIDEDYGQLESQTDQYPVVFPCVLIGMGDTEWQPMANRPGPTVPSCAGDEVVAEDVRTRPAAQHRIRTQRRHQSLRGDVRIPRAGNLVIIPRRTGGVVRPSVSEP